MLPEYYIIIIKGTFIPYEHDQESEKCCKKFQNILYETAHFMIWVDHATRSSECNGLYAHCVVPLRGLKSISPLHLTFLDAMSNQSKSKFQIKFLLTSAHYCCWPVTHSWGCWVGRPGQRWGLTSHRRSRRSTSSDPSWCHGSQSSYGRGGRPLQTSIQRHSAACSEGWWLRLYRHTAGEEISSL